MFVVLLADTAWGFGYLVYDPANLAQTSVSAANAVRQTAQMVESYMIQIQQLEAQFQNLRTLPQTLLDQVVLPYAQQWGTLQTLAGSLDGAYQQLLSLHQTYLGQSQQMAAQGLPPSDYLNQEITLSQARGQGLSAAFQQQTATLQSLATTSAQLDSLQGQVAASSGLQQSVQTVNQHLHLLASQNGQLLGLMASDQANRSAREQFESDRTAQAGQVIQQRQQDDAVKLSQWQNNNRQEEGSLGWGVLQTNGAAP